MKVTYRRLRLKRSKLVELRNIVLFNFRKRRGWCCCGVGFTSAGLARSFGDHRIKLSSDLIGNLELLICIQNLVAPARFSHRPLSHHVWFLSSDPSPFLGGKGWETNKRKWKTMGNAKKTALDLGLIRAPKCKDGIWFLTGLDYNGFAL